MGGATHGWVSADISQGIWLSVATAIALGHYAIDCWKIAASRPYLATGSAVPSRFFVWDQIAHLLWIVAVVTQMYLLLADNGLQTWAIWPEGLALKAMGIYVVWGPSSHVVRIVVSPFAPPNSPSQNG
ncbi:MAG: DUF3307 domain-containing protein, partial [Proteobacteria bacterium]|nr:DUF3307 domain-containing protein [Pseudomonadota bacterium]